MGKRAPRYGLSETGNKPPVNPRLRGIVERIDRHLHAESLLMADMVGAGFTAEEWDVIQVAIETHPHVAFTENLTRTFSRPSHYPSQHAGVLPSRGSRDRPVSRRRRVR